MWSGSAFEVQSSTLNDLMTKLNQCIADLSAFDAILLLKDLYISICDEISRLYSAMVQCSSGHIHFDIATAWEQEPYHSQQYG